MSTIVRDNRIIDQIINTMSAFLKQSKLVVKPPSVTRTHTANINAIKIDDFYVNPKVYLSHPKSKKKFLVTSYKIFFDEGYIPKIFFDETLKDMVTMANVGVYWSSNFWNVDHSEFLRLTNLVAKKVAEYKIFPQFCHEAQREWIKCENEKRTLLAGYFNNSKKKNKIRSVFHEKLTDFLVKSQPIRDLDKDLLLKIFQIDAEELGKLADFIAKNKKELRFVSNEDINSAFEESKVKFIMTE